MGDGKEKASEKAKSPKLVVLCGYPCSGKSTIAEYLYRKYDFVVLNTDAIRYELGYVFNPFAEDLPEKERERFYEMEEVLLHTVNLRKHKLILDGKNVVIDSCAIYEKTRNDMLFSYLAKKYLIFLNVDKHILIDRNLQKGRKEAKEILVKLERYWQEPRPSENYTLITYPNNTREDLEILLKDLDSRIHLK